MIYKLHAFLSYSLPDYWHVMDLKKQMQAPVVATTDLVGDMKTEVIDMIISGIDKHSTNLETASKVIKESLDKQFGLTWQVVIGRGFSFDITSLQKTMMHCFYQGELAILVYKS